MLKTNTVTRRFEFWPQDLKSSKEFFNGVLPAVVKKELRSRSTVTAETSAIFIFSITTFSWRQTLSIIKVISCHSREINSFMCVCVLGCFFLRKFSYWPSLLSLSNNTTSEAEKEFLCLFCFIAKNFVFSQLFPSRMDPRTFASRRNVTFSSVSCTWITLYIISQWALQSWFRWGKTSTKICFL